MTSRTALQVVKATALSLFPVLLGAQSVRQSVVSLGTQKYTVTARSTVVAAGDITSAFYATPVSPAFNGVGSIDITSDQGRFLCTGSLLADGQTVLTAAHCLTGEIGNVSSIKVNFFPNGATPVTMTASSWMANPGYAGTEVIDENDVGVIHLNAIAPSNISRYGLATTSAVTQNFQFVGFGENGSFGQGADPNTGFFDLGSRFTGANTFDIQLGDPRWEGFWDEPDAFVSHVLFADFDNGTTGFDSNDGMCWIGQYFQFMGSTACNAGLGVFEANTGPGDSGGPGFVNGKIASITSFGLTFGQFGPGPFPDIDNNLNSSFGEFAGFTDVAFQSAWITSQMNPNIGPITNGPQVAPEPASLVLFGTGMIGIGLARRRRRV